MSGAVQKSWFFLCLPDLKNLVKTTLSLEDEAEEPRSKQLKTCRELVLLYSDVLASPALDSFTDITVVMAIPMYQKGIIQMFAQRHCLQLAAPQCVLPGVLQCCLSYSLITRLAPSWNKAGLYLISGNNFLTNRERMDAVSMELNSREGQLCISIEASRVRLPPTTLEDFNLTPFVLSRFCSDPHSILEPSSTGRAIWCHVLPSMKKGQIITISRQLPEDGPFRSYRELQNHWNCLYGYRLPDLAEDEVVYCSVYFRLVGDRLFTYPLSCIRLQPVQRCPGVDLQGALGSFLLDVNVRLQSVCGFPARVTSKPYYHTVGLSTAATAQGLSSEQVNSTTSSSTRLVHSQVPAHPAQNMKPVHASQPPAWTPLFPQDQTQGLRRSHGATGAHLWPLSSSSQVSLFSGVTSAPSFTSSSFSHLQSSSSITSSIQSISSSADFQSTSSFTSSSSCSPAPSTLPLHTQTSVNPAKQVPIFRTKLPSCHINVSLLRVQKQQQGAGVERRGRVTIPTLGRSEPTAAPAPTSFTFSSLLTMSHCTPQGSTVHPSASPKAQHVFSLSPQSKHRPNLPSKPGIKPELKPILKTSSTRNTTKQPEPPEDPHPASTYEVSNTDASSGSGGKAVCDSKVKKSRSAVQDVDVEIMARSNQLFKLNSATLLAWLRRRGVPVDAKHRKDLLMLKVMACLAED